MDQNGARISGPIQGRGARAIWRDGILYVAIAIAGGSQTYTATSFPVPEEPRKWGGGWRATAEDGNAIMVQRPTCSCHVLGWLGKVAAEDIIAASLPFSPVVPQPEGFTPPALSDLKADPEPIDLMADA